MSESNPAGQYGQQRPGWSQQDFMKGGMSHDHANEAAAAATRAKAAQQQKS